MGTETRIGIVTGLVIVVVASVYFFYGNNTKEADFFVSTGPKISAPSISAAGDRATTPVQSERAAATGSTGRAEPRVVPPDKGRQAHRAGRTIGGAATGGGEPGRPRPGMNQEDGLQAAGAGASVFSRDPQGSAPGRQSSTALRTGPAARLVEATRQNLQKGDSSSETSGTDLASIGRRVRQANWRKRRNVETSKPGDEATERPPVRRGAPGVSTAAAGWPKKHTVAAGDTLSEIADLYYGRAGRFGVILEANPHLEGPHALKIGAIITIPAPPDPVSAKAARTTARPSRPPSHAAATTYRVRRGDSFYSIARAHYGSGLRWTEVFELNKELVKNDPKRLRPGMVIRLP